jgi:predicted nucleic acid-binding protein
MIVLDASLLIAYLSTSDPRHRRSVTILAEHAAEPLAIPALTLAETLVGPARAGRASEVLEALSAMELTVIQDVEPSTLAALRASSGLRMPDAVVLHTALRHTAALATFDERLAAAAVASGVTVHGTNTALLAP